ncbi:hypothetical protein EAF00_000135 [Botryotinia globosa]|nr:hypothetical protein EAF00_000135 [Botryotinia globosa]
MAKPAQHYEVIIAGGGIAGVTLALMFEKLCVSYLLLEGRNTLKSDRGAGIGLQPNGLRILDQLGLVEDIEEATIPLEKWFSSDSEGNLMNDSDAMGQYREKIGYPVAFIERRKLLPIMTLVLPAPQSMAYQRPPKASPRASALPFAERTKQSLASRVKTGLYSGSSLRISARTSHCLRPHDTSKLRPRLSAKALPQCRQ